MSCIIHYLLSNHQQCRKILWKFSNKYEDIPCRKHDMKKKISCIHYWINNLHKQFILGILLHYSQSSTVISPTRINPCPLSSHTTCRWKLHIHICVYLCSCVSALVIMLREKKVFLNCLLVFGFLNRN